MNLLLKVIIYAGKSKNIQPLEITQQKAYLCLGSNLGDRVNFLRAACTHLSEFGTISAISALYESPGWGTASPNLYLNQVVLLNTNLDAQQLLREINQIEMQLGRERSADQYADRHIDIDILLFGQTVMQDSNLIIPHPRLHLRRFALLPLSEIASEEIHPVFKKNIGQLLIDCPDTSQVNICNNL